MDDDTYAWVHSINKPVRSLRPGGWGEGTRGYRKGKRQPKQVCLDCGITVKGRAMANHKKVCKGKKA